MPKKVKKYNKFLIVLGVVLFSLISFSQKKNVYALTQPTRIEINGEPGKVLTGILELYNEQEQEITFYLSYQNFEARGETGSPSYLDYDGTGLASWIKTAQSVTLKAKERIEFPYEIQIPQDTQPGSYLAAIFFGNTPAEATEAGQVTIGAKSGTLLFLNLPGAEVKGAGVIEFGTEKTENEKAKFFSYLPVNLYYRFSNDGAVKIMPSGNIEIKCLFGRTVGNLDANLSRGNVLPNSIRKFVATWERLNQDNVNKKEDANEKELIEIGENVGFFDAVKIQLNNFAFGKYTADLNLQYGESNTVTKQASFWVVPWQLLSIVLFALIIIILLFRGMMKRHNKKLIEKIKKETLTSQQVTIAPTESVVAEEKKVREKIKKEVKKEIEEKQELVEEIKEDVKEEMKEEAEEVKEEIENIKDEIESEVSATEEDLTPINPKE